MEATRPRGGEDSASPTPGARLAPGASFAPGESKVENLQHTESASYKAGGRASALYAAMGTPNLPGQAALAAAYVAQLKTRVVPVLGGAISANFVPIQYHGDFNWYWTDGINLNALTHDYISGAVTPSSGEPGSCQIGGAGTFGNLYQQLINGIAWQLSAADNAALQQAMTQGQTQATSIVQADVSTYGAPTPAQMKAARAINPLISTPLDYIMLHQAGYLWAGKPIPPLSLYAMQNASDLRALLQYAPVSAQPTIQAMPPYLAALGVAATLTGMQSLGAFILQQIKNNLSMPSATNGGISSSTRPAPTIIGAYSSNLTPSEILQDFGDASRQMTMSFAATTAASSCTITFPAEPASLGAATCSTSAPARRSAAMSLGSRAPGRP